MTRLTLENENGKYTVEIEGDGMDIDGMWEELIRPILLVANFHPDSINRFLNGDDNPEA